MLNILVFQAYFFGCLPLKFEKSSNRVVNLKVVKIFNNIFFFFLIFIFSYKCYRSSQSIIIAYQDPKVFVSAVNEVTVLFYEVSCYGFIKINLNNIKNLINEIVELSSILLKNENDLKIFSVHLIFQSFFLQPLIYFYLLSMIFTTFTDSHEKNIFFIISLFFLYPVRLLQIFFCLFLKFNSILLAKVAEIDKNSNFVYIFNETMKSTSKICKVFDSYVRVFLLSEFFFLLTCTFYFATVIIAWIQNKTEQGTIVVGIIIIIIGFLISVEVLNLASIIQSCKHFRIHVSVNLFLLYRIVFRKLLEKNRVSRKLFWVSRDFSNTKYSNFINSRFRGCCESSF